MSSEDYVRIAAVLVRVNPRSFILRREDGDEVVVGRSCVNGCDEPAVADAIPGDEVELRVFRWLAEREGLI